MVIVAIVATLSPAALLMALFQEIKPPSPQPTTVQIVTSEPVEHLNCLVPKPSRELVVSFLNKQWTGLFSFFDGFALPDKDFASAEGHDYFYNNEVHFNIPPLMYRQPSSEHASEG
jgi:hypothetical protein